MCIDYLTESFPCTRIVQKDVLSDEGHENWRTIMYFALFALHHSYDCSGPPWGLVIPIMSSILCTNVNLP